MVQRVIATPLLGIEAPTGRARNREIIVFIFEDFGAKSPLHVLDRATESDTILQFSLITPSDTDLSHETVFKPDLNFAEILPRDLSSELGGNRSREIVDRLSERDPRGGDPGQDSGSEVEGHENGLYGSRVPVRQPVMAVICDARWAVLAFFGCSKLTSYAHVA